MCKNHFPSTWKVAQIIMIPKLVKKTEEALYLLPSFRQNMAYRIASQIEEIPLFNY